jgi:hypothetical protein
MMTREKFMAIQRNELARFDAHCERHGIDAQEDEDAWYQALAEFFEPGAPHG